jgi:hypothetical protein
MLLIARLAVSTSVGDLYHQFWRYKNVPVVNKSGDRCN